MITKYKYGLIGIVLILMLGSTVRAQTQTGYRIPPRVDIGGGRMTGDMYLQAGTSGVRLYIGTDTVTQVGTSGVITGTIATNLPYLHFRYDGGSTSVNFVGFNQVMVGSTAVSIGDMSLKVNITSGTCTGLTGTNTTLQGTTTIPSGAVFSTNGRVLTGIEVSYLDGLSDFLTTLLAAKQNDLGGTYCASMSDDVGTRTGAIRLGVSGDLTLSIINGEFVFGQVGSISAKPSTLENGGTVTASPSFIDYDGDDFDPVGSGTGSRIALSSAQKGSSTPTANTVIKADGSSTINNFTKDLRSGNDQYTKLLLHGDQIGSLSTYLDSSEQEWTVNSIGGVNGTTSQSVFGGGSLAFDGTNDRLSIADNSLLELGSNNFMLEMRARSNNGEFVHFMTKEQTVSTDYINIAYDPSNAQINFQQKSAGSFVIQAGSGSWTASANTWYHIAVIRKGSKFRFYVDGSQIGSDVSDSDAIVDNTGAWNIGGIPSDTNGLNGYLDEVRMTIGTGRKPAGTFTVATEAYGSFTSSLSN